MCNARYEGIVAARSFSYRILHTLTSQVKEDERTSYEWTPGINRQKGASQAVRTVRSLQTRKRSNLITAWSPPQPLYTSRTQTFWLRECWHAEYAYKYIYPYLYFPSRLIHGPCGTISSAASNQFIKALKWMLSDLLHASMCKSVQHGCDSCMLFAIAFVIHD